MKKLLLFFAITLAASQLYATQKHQAPPLTQPRAEEKCPNICSNFGGWTGQWWNEGGTTGYCECNS